MNFPIDLSPALIAKAEFLSVKPEDIDEQFIRGSGHGGQKINKTNSCVQLRHIPTGIEVRCQKHREQSKNRLSAYKLLLLKIEEQKLGKQSAIAQKIFKLKKQKARRSRKAQQKVLEAKKIRGEVKRLRRDVD